jgi:hypothetical protein
MELAADGFVAEQVRAALASGDPTVRASAAKIRDLTRRFVSQQAAERFGRHPPSRNVGVFTRATNPNATPSGDRRVVYGDPTRTHPNLELRMMVIGYRIDPTPESARSLRSYLDARGDRVLPQILRLPEPTAVEKPVQGNTP